eukprot:GDKJ01018277.1.p1 GENE.GDKJ01018277.1~~GDKJ01018277.1.p1  ORF type:complete len:295 (-),score=42.02 GDKJ01018277.1:63-947(-)
MSYPTDILVGVIGGSGVYKMDCLENPVQYKISTPFGEPSDVITVATVKGVKCAFLPRHGRGHVVTPTEVNYQANIFALKLVGVKYLLSIAAVGSLHEKYQPGDLCFYDQLIDRTIARKSTFFGRGIVAHVPFGHPVCEKMHDIALAATKAALPESVKLHPKGTLVTMEGPVFSTKAESLMNRQFGGDLIGMTSATEAKLAREAEMAFAGVAMVTDLDAWHDEDHVDVAKVMKTMAGNAEHAQNFTAAIIEAVGTNLFESPCHSAMSVAIMTRADAVPPQILNEMQPLVGKYLKA